MAFVGRTIENHNEIVPLVVVPLTPIPNAQICLNHMFPKFYAHKCQPLNIRMLFTDFLLFSNIKTARSSSIEWKKM